MKNLSRLNNSSANAFMKKLILQALILAVAAIAAFATTVVHVSFNEQALQADLAIVGRVVRVEDAEKKGFPFSRAVVSIEETIAGEAPGPDIDVYQAGGHDKRNGHEVRVEGLRYLKPGDEVFLFLKALPEGGYEIIGLFQGIYSMGIEKGTGRKIIIGGQGSEKLVMTLDAARGRVHAVRANSKANGNGPGGKPK